MERGDEPVWSEGVLGEQKAMVARVGRMDVVALFMVDMVQSAPCQVVRLAESRPQKCVPH